MSFGPRSFRPTESRSSAESACGQHRAELEAPPRTTQALQTTPLRTARPRRPRAEALDALPPIFMALPGLGWVEPRRDSQSGFGEGRPFFTTESHGGPRRKSWTEAWVILRSDNPARDAFRQSAQDEVAPRIAPVSFSRRNINRSEEQTSCRSGDSSRRCFVRSVRTLFSVVLRG